MPPRPAPAELGLPLRLSDEPEFDEVESIQKDSVDPSLRDRPGFRLLPIDLMSDDLQTRRAFSAMRALRKRLSLTLDQPEQSLAADTTLFSLASERPRCVGDLEGSKKRYVDLGLRTGAS